MNVRKAFLASVSTVFLAACVAVSGSSAAATLNASTQLAAEAYRALSAGNPVDAIVSYTTAIESRELEPEVLANALLNRGLAYQHLNRHEQAVDDYSAAMRIDAMSGKLRAMALYNRGVSYQKLQQTALAMEDFTSALFLDAGFSYAYYSRANILRDSGQYLFALSDYEKAIQTGHPEPARIYYAEALTFDALDRPGNARDALTKAIAANPDYLPARKRLAALDGDTDDAMTTSSIASVGRSLFARKQQLPQATAPDAALASLRPPKKLYSDRVPQEAPAAAAAVEEKIVTEEKIVAIEPVPEETAVESAAVKPVAAPQLTGWSVQVASATSEDAAWSTWKKMQAKHRALAGKTPIVVRADLGAKGTFYRVRLTGYGKQGDAKSACSALKSKGVNCFISRASS
jgi:tetratricopeptide (TPR) repeat protein